MSKTLFTKPAAARLSPARKSPRGRRPKMRDVTRAALRELQWDGGRHHVRR